MYNTKQNRK